MKFSRTLVILVVAMFCCVTEKAQNIENDTQATQADIQRINSNEQAIKPDAKKIQSNEWLTYEPTVVELRGKLITKWYYGPPNYGENPKTDSRELLPFLVLDRPVSVRGNPDPDAGPDQVSVEHVRTMELGLTLPHKNMIGKNVIVKGMLFHAFTGHHHTDVLMLVQSISLLESRQSSRHENQKVRYRPCLRTSLGI